VLPPERPEDFVRRVTRRIASVRQAAGMTQEQFADALGTAARNIRRIEAGQNLTLYTLARIASVFGVRPDQLLVGDPGDQESHPSARPAKDRKARSPTPAAAEKTPRPRSKAERKRAKR
jgi:transcriptional regulator with XRE-family HTH domain